MSKNQKWLPKDMPTLKPNFSLVTLLCDQLDLGNHHAILICYKRALKYY